MRPLVIASITGIGFGLVAGVIVRIMGVERRWKWPTSSPNDLAILAGILTLIALYVAFRFREKSKTTPRQSSRKTCLTVAFLALVLSVVFEAMLVATCSRGGILAVVVSLVFGAIVFPPHRRLMSVFLCCSLLAAVLIVPRTLSRISIDPRSDASVETRLDVMRGASAMLWDCPFGVGSERFGDIRERWYMEKAREVSIWHPLNDGLWLGTERGIVVMFGFYFIMLFPIVSSIFFSLRTRVDVDENVDNQSQVSNQSVISCCLIIFLIGGFFTTLCRPDGICWVLIVLMAIAYPLTIRSFFASKMSVRSSIMRSVIATASLALLGVACWLLLGVNSLTRFPWKPVPGGDGLEAIPRLQPVNSKILVFRSVHDSDSDICRLVLRNLASSGFRIRLASQHNLIESTQFLVSPQESSLLFMPSSEDCLDTLIAHKPNLKDFPAVYMEWNQDRLPPLGDVQPALILYGRNSFNDISNDLKAPGVKPIAYEIRRVDEVARCWPRFFMRYQDVVVNWIKNRSATPRVVPRP